MAIEQQVLDKLLKFGIDKGYFEFTTIGQLDKSCCPKAKVEVIDFDKTKDIITKKFNLVSLKSCDAIKIIPENNCIDFIEMKSLANISKNIKIKTETNLKTQVDNFDLKGKIRDSLYILSTIALQNNALHGAELSIYHDVKKNYIILSDINFEDNPVDFIALTFDFMEYVSSSIKNIMKESVDKINANETYNLQKPILIDCEKFNNYY